MFECYCSDGFYLHSNGYNCIGKIPPSPPTLPNLLTLLSAFNSSKPEEEVDPQPAISIQIEVDIQPPEEAGGEKLSEEELAQLGLPARHIHYTAGSGEQRDGPELLQPVDIQLTFADTEGRTGGVTEVEVPELEHETLPDLADNIYQVDAYCGLSCGPGHCRILESREKRCLCPLGLTGSRCQEPLLLTGAPSLSGHSHLTLPTLENAYSDLHLALDFKPRSLSGLLIITGQTLDMTGDYLALILSDGFVELR